MTGLIKIASREQEHGMAMIRFGREAVTKIDKVVDTQELISPESESLPVSLLGLITISREKTGVSLRKEQRGGHARRKEH